MHTSHPSRAEKSAATALALKTEIRAALAGSSTKHPVDTELLAEGHQRRRVEAALMDLYQAREICCCKIIKGGLEKVVWWEVGGYRAAADVQPRFTRPQSSLTVQIKQLVVATPGISMSKICEALNVQSHNAQQIRNAVQSLIRGKDIYADGPRGKYQYKPVVAV